MATQTPVRAIKEAKKMASDYGMFVVEKPGRFLLYRQSTPRNVYLGFRSDVAAFRRFVEACAYNKNKKAVAN
ncbi:MAG: hypothetical protein CVU31_02630 [Betaproteobacteria bacterium HGW-Betaproteobacteria-4]|jgi:hypothetical protein|nr:MAG: hypothetical protein CVU31_02630 [Betaproteobacteria bacterium HGW-Betaproteobacteria-4]